MQDFQSDLLRLVTVSYLTLTMVDTALHSQFLSITPNR